MSTISTLGDAQFDDVGIDGDPSAFGAEAMVLKLNDSEFVCVRANTAGAMTVEKYNLTPKLIWSTPVTFPDSDPAVERELMWKDMSVETMIAFYRTDSDLVSISYRFGRGDTLMAIGRRFDPANGKQTKMKVLDTMPDQSGIPEWYRQYIISFSPDSSRILLRTNGTGPDGENMLRIVSVSSDFASGIQRTMPIYSPGIPSPPALLHIDDAGDVYLISAGQPDTIRCTKFDMGTGTLGSTFTTSIPDVRETSASLDVITTSFDDSSDLVVLVSLKYGQTMRGIASATFDTRHDRFVQAKSVVFNAKLLKKLVYDTTFENAMLRRVITTNDPGARTILFYEQEKMREVSFKRGPPKQRYTDYKTEFQTGNVLLLAFDRNGEPAWQRGLAKTTLKSDVPWSLLTTSAGVTAKRTLRLVFRERDYVLMSEYRLSDGEEVAASSKIMEMNHAYFLGDFTTWFDDKTMIMLLRRGVLFDGWTIGTYRMK